MESKKERGQLVQDNAKITHSTITFFFHLILPYIQTILWLKPCLHYYICHMADGSNHNNFFFPKLIMLVQKNCEPFSHAMALKNNLHNQNKSNLLQKTSSINVNCDYIFTLLFFLKSLVLKHISHYKKIILHQRFFPSAFQNRRNRLTYSSAFRNRLCRTPYYCSSKSVLHKLLQQEAYSGGFQNRQYMRPYCSVL